MKYIAAVLCGFGRTDPRFLYRPGFVQSIAMLQKETGCSAEVALAAFEIRRNEAFSNEERVAILKQLEK